MENCYDCNHCEVCRWIDKFKDKGVCDFYETLEKHDEEVIKETVESIWGKPPYTELLDKIRAEIEENRWTDKNIRIERNALASGLDVALDIIDKYIAGKEQK